MTKKLLSLSALLAIGVVSLAGCGGKKGGDEYVDGKLKLNLKNLYFSDWTGGDAYTEQIENKFQVKITGSSYSYADWGTQVSSAVNANNLPDVFHFDLESFNFGSTYEFWANGRVIKALPDDMSKWPNLNKMINNVSNSEALKINGKLYGIPISYNINDPSKDYSSFTYLYRRDWAKQCGVYKANDEYTWDEFLDVIETFQEEIDLIISGDACALADVEWGFPSITNFYKEAPHCYTYVNNKVVNAFTTDKYCEGLTKARQLVNQEAYYEQVSANTGDTYNKYKAGQVGIYYENLSLTNYTNLRKDYKTNHPNATEAELDDALAFMKVKGPDGKYHLEGTDNWFSMTMFNDNISDTKMNKILDILDYLLGEEGTKLAVYGIEGYDYEVVGGKIQLLESGWMKDKDGNYVNKVNGAKYLRYMATLGYDTQGYDPLINKKCYSIINEWNEAMRAAKNNNEMFIFMEPTEIKWMSGPLKNQNTSGMLNEGNDNAMKFCYGETGYGDIASYKSKFSSSKWDPTLAEINNKLGK